MTATIPYGPQQNKNFIKTQLHSIQSALGISVLIQI